MAFLKWFTVGAALVFAGCSGFSPTSPFGGFDGQGSRVTGTFEAPASGQAVSAHGRGDKSAQGVRVYVKENPSLSVVVGSGGTFTLVGVPAGSFTLVFERDGQIIGEIRLQSVRQSQEITIIVIIVNGRVELVEQDRDHVSFEGECPRGAGFWCQNQGGSNPNLSAGEFQEFAEKASVLLAAVPALDTKEEVAAAVCNTGNQLLRHLATLGLNLAAGTIAMDEPLSDEPYATVRAAFDAAVAVANGGSGDRNRIKDVIERINENRNHDVCDDQTMPDDDAPGDDDDPPGDDDPPVGGLSCHGVAIPRGQLPPPGECKIWDPGKPAGQQGPPGNCAALAASQPAGTCLVDHNGVVNQK